MCVLFPLLVNYWDPQMDLHICVTAAPHLLDAIGTWSLIQGRGPYTYGPPGIF
jgi:hypothetical protein